MQSSILTRRQRQVMELVAQGLTNAEIAARLGIKEYTVKGHLNALRYKIDASHKAHMVAVLFRMGELR
jgi:DNA-binding CsgD family transcriptional regulator